MKNIFKVTSGFSLESGIRLPDFHLAYSTYGQLNENKDNVIWIFHALTANSEAADWWPGLIGENKLFDPTHYFIICVNMPGSCYGSIGPLDLNPVTGSPYYHDFPLFTTRDMIRSYQLLKNYLGIQKVCIGIGGSMGGQQLLEWAIEEPSLFTFIIPLATNSFHSPWGIAFNATQRHCIEIDPTWPNKHPKAGSKGMMVAREMAILSYRNYHTYLLHQKEEDTTKTGAYKSESYQQYQGEKLAKRFNAYSYYLLSKVMDAHHLGRGRNTIQQALQTIRAKTLVISIRSDILFPPEEQQWLAEHIQNGVHVMIDSDYGHDGFLIEYDKITTEIRKFLKA